MKFLKSYLVLFLLLFIIASCNKTVKETVPKKLGDKELIEMYSKVGEIHNQGLDYMYKLLKRNGDNQDLNRNYATGTQIAMIDINEHVMTYLHDSLGITGNLVPIYNVDTLLQFPDLVTHHLLIIIRN